MVVDVIRVDNITFSLERDLDEYKVIRKEGKYVHTEFLGKISKDEAEYKFNFIVNN